MAADNRKNQTDLSEPVEVKTRGNASYMIYPEDSFQKLALCLEEIGSRDCRICVVTDSNVEKLYLQEVLDLLKGSCRELISYTLPAGEEHKNLDEIRKLYQCLIEHEMDRRDLIVALGGGVTGDMAGFAAATYLRGIRFIQVPTTLLAQVDSSIGGKTGVDLDSYKNMVGAFHQPSLVYLNISTLKTLDGTQFASGMGEVLKHGLIRDAAYYEWCLDHMGEIEEREDSILKEMVVRSVLIKRAVVQKDPLEKGERALLNFGHTLGHAVEKTFRFDTYSHGEGVAIGMVLLTRQAEKLGLTVPGTAERIEGLLKKFNLPVSVQMDQADFLKAIALDKKKRCGDLPFRIRQRVDRGDNG